MYDEHGMKSTIPMHRDVMGVRNGEAFPDGRPMEVDHIDRNRRHNCRCNLRVVDRYENEGNKPRDPSWSSQTTGITRDRRTGKWKAQASLDGKYVYLGIFDTEEAAAAARWAWEEETGRRRWRMENGPSVQTTLDM
jgi:hypothetical protein